jgi:hypothetical protein
METIEKEKFQVFTLKLNEEETSLVVATLMQCTAGDVYNTLKRIDEQTTAQHKLPDDQKEYENNKRFIFAPIKKEGS